MAAPDSVHGSRHIDTHMCWDGPLRAVLRDQVHCRLLLVAEHSQLLPVLSLYWRRHIFTASADLALHGALARDLSRAVCIDQSVQIGEMLGKKLASNAYHAVAAGCRSRQAFGFAGCCGCSIAAGARGSRGWPLLLRI